MASEDPILRRIRDYREQLAKAPGTWPAKRELAAAIRDLMDCLCATDAPEAELRAIARQVRQSADRFADQPRMTEPPGVAEGSLVGGMETFMDRSPIVGLSNPVAPPAKLDPDHDARVVRGQVTFGNAYEGAPGCAHGGLVAAILDEALGMACMFSGGPGMTGEITIRYLKPTPTRVPLRIEARFDRQEGRKIFNSGEIYAGDTPIVRSHGVFISIAHEKFAELRAAQRAREYPPPDAGG